MRAMLIVFGVLALSATRGFGQISLANTAAAPPSATAQAVGTCLSVDTSPANVMIGAGSCARTASPANQCYVPTGIALDPMTNGCLGLGASNPGFTIQWWYRPDPTQTFLIYTFGDAAWVGTNGAFRCFANSSAGAGNLRVRGPLTELTTVGAPLTTALNPNGYVHFALVIDTAANSISWYVNGALNSSGIPNITGSGTNFTCMGYNGSSTAGADGNYDDYRVYDWARDAADIAADYMAQASGLAANGCPNVPDLAYFECESSQNAHDAVIARGSEPGFGFTRLFTDLDTIRWSVSSPAPGPFAGTALINVGFGAGAQPRIEGYNDPTPVPGSPYTTLGYPGVALGHCASVPQAAFPLTWPDTTMLGGIGVIPCGGLMVPVPFVYGGGTSPPDISFNVPPGVFVTGDRIDIQWVAPDGSYASGIGSSNRVAFEYVAAIGGEHAHIEARGISSLQVTGFWEIHNTGDVPIQQVCIDLTNASTTNGWNPTGALNSGGTLATLDTFRRNTDIICDLINPPGFTVTGNVLCFDFDCAGPNGGFEGPTDHFIFDSDLTTAVGGGAMIGADITVTYCNGIVQTGILVGDPNDPLAAILDL